MALLERGSVLESLDQFLAEASDGIGRVVLLSGEAGIGKTSIVDEFMELHREAAHILWGGCDDLLSARPLGPIWDMAMDEPGLGRLLRDGDRYEAFTELLSMMSRSLRPTLIIIEDVHWADDSTRDLIKFLGRRIGDTHSLLLLTYRDDEVKGDHPLRTALGDLPSGVVERISLDPLSPSSVLELAGNAALAESIWDISKGNPFFVTEMIAAGGRTIPTSISDAVSSRVMRLDAEARSFAELVSVVPGRAEVSLLQHAIGDIDRSVRECEGAGILEVRGDYVSFRHELARRAVEGQLPEMRRRSLNALILNACEELGFDVTRCAHHARLAGDVDAIIRHIPRAARRAAEVESHHEALQQLRALEPYLDRLTETELADHFELLAWEEHLTGGDLDREAIEKALRLRRRLGDAQALGNALLKASRIAWVGTRRASSVALATEATDVLETVGGQDLAMAYSTLSQLAMLASDSERTFKYADRAMQVAGDGPSQARAHALANIGAIKLNLAYPDGTLDIEQSFEMSAQLGLSADQARAAVNLSWSALTWHDLGTAELWIDKGLQIAYERELPTFENYLVAEKAHLAEMRGDWITAEALVREAADGTWQLVASTIAHTILGRIQVRQGTPEASKTILDAWELAKQSDEIQRLGPAGALMAEAAWMGLSVDAALIAELIDVMEASLGTGITWYGGGIGLWLFLNGTLDEIPQACPEPYLLLGSGDWEGAARYWEDRSVVYEQAVALSQGDTGAKLRAIEVLDRLGAVPLASRVRSELVQAGVTGIPRGPQTATRQNSLGLTPRQTDVLKLLADGLTNAEIADHLFVSTRTVDHHVSAILTKTGASSRHEAVQIARGTDMIS